ncbi:6-phosphogluconolactonase [Brooklawnia cerclae]|uniref:6-phosphogluconolactonase n=1 Tax=Brooklawnia cerclae TaxID=349934 RepID=A0ABX0SHV8_9ACTN|nr:6-phosphogluconolactonase [Brooklawnia cerclae]NIH57479.1 6-phosphogluconolactonase [Brooklawnia cerclae]
MSLERVLRYRSLGELAPSMAGRLARRLVELQDDRDRVHVALAGGNTSVVLYEAFANLARATALDFGKLELWWTSERYVPTTDPDRNSTQALSVLARTLPIVSSQVHPMPSTTGTSDPDEAAYLYANELGDTVFDICLLGVGTDGHIASIYPDHPSFAVQSETSLLAVGVLDAPNKPCERMTLTLNALNRSHEVWLLASGREKAHVVSRALQHDPSLPASLVHGVTKTNWFLDWDAASELPYYRCEF